MTDMGISQPTDLRGRKALVTGAARGIGAAAAMALATEGADVALADITSIEQTTKAIQGLGRKAVAIRASVADADDAQRMAAEAIKGLGHIDILVNNAGIIQRDSLMDTSVGTWDRVMDVILKGTFLCTQALYPHMRARGYGKIVNVSSISGIIGGAISKGDDTPEKMKGRSGPAYAAAKGGVLALTRWLAKDVAKDGIYVNSVAPGATETDMTSGFDYNVQALPIARLGHPNDIAQAIVFLASSASDYVTGQVINVDGGWVMG